jgi:enterochelin esterase-like enzyme
LLNLLIQIASVLLIWFLAKRQFITPNSRTRRWWNWSPVAIGIVLVIVLLRFPPPVNPAFAQIQTQNTNQARVPSRYGTPVPRQSQSTAPIPTPTVDPLPRPSTLPGTDILTSPYLLPTQGTVRERWFYSPELDRDMPYYIYLPPDYGTADRKYPVLYMLHGLGGHREEWIAYGLINVVDQEITSGSLQPMIVVLPQGDKGYWTNHTGEGPLWGEYLYRDVVNMIDSTYRTIRAPQARAIGGLSMGGWGALSTAFLHPNIFGIVGAHSASLRPFDGELPYLGGAEEYATKDPLALAVAAPGIEGLRIWIDAGEEDAWAARSRQLSQELRDRGIDHILQIYPGGHDYTYWSEHTLDYVRFYGSSFARQ